MPDPAETRHRIAKRSRKLSMLLATQRFPQNADKIRTDHKRKEKLVEQKEKIAERRAKLRRKQG